MTVEEWLGEDNTLGIKIWKNKYRHNDESFEEWLDRVSGNDEEVKDLIREQKFIFGGRILANRGLQHEGRKITYSNCYVIKPPEDNLEDIWRASYDMAKTYAYGGGCGIDISKLSPRGAKIHNAAKTTSGAASFMELYNTTTKMIGQNGRRGALMISMDCTHPDIEEFISAKEDVNNITSANISVKMTDRFMRAVELDDEITLSYDREETGERIRKTVRARDIFDKLCEMNWRSGEPGILFWDRIKGWNLLSEDPEFEYAGVNPCAEEPLPAGGSCLLGAINLSEFVIDGEIDWDELSHAVYVAVDALNDVLDEGLALHPLECQRNSVKDWRQIGLGIMGLADAFIKLGVTYGSKKAIGISKELASFIASRAIWKSYFLAWEEGSYPMCNWKAIVESGYFRNLAKERLLMDVGDIKSQGLRNSQLLTIAPTGSIANLFGVSNGIEPLFATHYTRKTESLDGETTYYEVYPKIVKEYLDKTGATHNNLPACFITADKINFENRILIQAAWQEYIDASISSTINVPNDFTIEDTKSLYMLAWKHGLKGVTMFRAGCERDAVLKTDEPKNNTPEPPMMKNEEEANARLKELVDNPSLYRPEHEEYFKSLERGQIVKANDICIGRKRTLQTGCGTLHLEAFFDPNTMELREVYLSKGSKGGCNNFMIGLSRMISLAARGGISYLDICDQLESSGVCPSYAIRKHDRNDTSPGTSCPVAVGKALKDICESMQIGVGMVDSIAKPIGKIISVNADGDGVKIKATLNEAMDICPECGERSLAHFGGCNSCLNCGYTKCD